MHTFDIHHLAEADTICLCAAQALTSVVSVFVQHRFDQQGLTTPQNPKTDPQQVPTR